MTPEHLAELRRIHEARTPGEWYVRHLDDRASMNLIAISTKPDTGKHEQLLTRTGHIETTLIAATLIQDPRYVDHSSELWDENAAAIVSTINNFGPLLDEVERLRAENQDLRFDLERISKSAEWAAEQARIYKNAYDQIMEPIREAIAAMAAVANPAPVILEGVLVICDMDKALHALEALDDHPN